MKRALFVTSRNILTSCGEIRLIKNRAEALYNTYGIPTDFLALQQEKRIISDKREDIKAGGGMDCYPMSLKNPFLFFSSYQKLIKTLREKLGTGRYGLVIFSGFAMPRLARIAKEEFKGIYSIIDIHGAREDSLLLAKHASLSKKILFYGLYYIGKLFPGNSMKFADGCFVVTDALEEYVRKGGRVSFNTKFYKVPCSTSMNRLTTESYEDFRKTYRLKYNITDDEKVFIYSGGVSPWQCVDETVDLYRKLKAKIDCKSRLLIFSYNIDIIKQKVGNAEDIVTDSYSPEELSKALCAGDYAFFLRKDCTTNNVAFPNKYLEYILAGMYIITTPYVYESAKQIERDRMGILYDFSSDISGVVEYIKNTPIQREYKVDRIENILSAYSFENTLKPLVSILSKYEKIICDC